jgi:hypothetical protein
MVSVPSRLFCYVDVLVRIFIPAASGALLPPAPAVLSMIVIGLLFPVAMRPIFVPCCFAITRADERPTKAKSGFLRPVGQSVAVLRHMAHFRSTLAA